MSSIFSTPKAPDPYATAAAQTGSNNATAQYQSQLNNVNQITPNGNLIYTQNSGTTGPKWTATQTLSPQQQAIADQQNAFNLKANQTANNQLNTISGTLSTPLDLSNNAVEGRLNELARLRLDPQWQQQTDQFQQNMLNRGIREGSEAYNNAYQQFMQGKNDAYNNLYLTGHQTAVGDIVRERQQPINEMTALLNGQQLQNPSYVTPAQTQVAGTNVAGLVNQNYQNQLQQQQAALGGLFGLGGAAISAFG
jgi:hypothetical protein